MDNFLLGGALALFLGLWGLFCFFIIPPEERFFAGLVVTVVLMGLFVALSVFLYKRPSYAKQRVFATLLSELWDLNPLVRSQAVEELVKLALERSSHGFEHDEIDQVLISALKHEVDPDVRANLVEGLTELEIDLEGLSLAS